MNLDPAYRQLSNPAIDMRAITPSASELNPRPRGLYIGEDGTISITNVDGDSVSNIPVFGGSVIPC